MFVLRMEDAQLGVMGIMGSIVSLLVNPKLSQLQSDKLRSISTSTKLVHSRSTLDAKLI